MSKDTNSSKETHPIIIFDGVCNFCHGAVSFIIKRDSKELFYFSPFQSFKAQKLLEPFKIKTSQLDSVILIKDGRCYMKSDAALEIAKELNGIYSYFYIFKFLPKKSRDYFYDLFAKNRYKMFGKKEQCMVPTQKIKKRFIY